MKKSIKRRSIRSIETRPRLLSVCLLALALLAINSYAAVDLGAASSFGLLAGSAITNSGDTTIDGDVGIWPNTESSITGFPPGLYTGTLHGGDAVAMQAQLDALSVYNDLAIMDMTQSLTGEDLGGQTLTEGVYNFTSSAQLTGSLTLDAQNNPDAVFVFQIGSTLTTASDSAITILNAPENFDGIYWQVGSSATLGTGTDFIGTILADTSITLNGGSLLGRAIALNGAITIAAQQTIIVPEPATIAILIFGTGFISCRFRKTNKAMKA